MTITPRLPAVLLAGCLFLASLTACAPPAEPEDDGILTVAATTYPVYLLADMVIGETEGVELVLVVDQPVSCLHDYTLSVNDMRTLARADVILINGVGFEAFMEDALAAADVPIIDCSEGIELLPYSGHEDHDHDHGHGGESDEEHYDPHIWMDPRRALQMAQNILDGLDALDTEGKYDFADPGRMTAPRRSAEQVLSLGYSGCGVPEQSRSLITFHDGFAYFADAFGLTVLKAVEEEAGSEASAREIAEITGLIRAYDIAGIFVEENGSDATAKVIRRETGVTLGTLTMMMSDNGMDYWEGMRYNIETVRDTLFTAVPI